MTRVLKLSKPLALSRFERWVREDARVLLRGKGYVPAGRKQRGYLRVLG